MDFFPGNHLGPQPYLRGHQIPESGEKSAQRSRSGRYRSLEKGVVLRLKITAKNKLQRLPLSFCLHPRRSNVSDTLLHNSIHIQYIFNTYSIHIQYIFNTYSIHIQYIFNTYSIHIQYIFNTYSMHIQYIFNTFCTHVHVCERDVCGIIDRA
jgi:hypothetical protein